MAFQDRRGVPSGSGKLAARDAAETALWRMMSGSGSPLADLDAAATADPDWAMPHVLRAGHLLSLDEPSHDADAAASLGRARACADGAPPREQAHLAAVTDVLDGRTGQACERWGELLVRSPHDALALHWAHHWDLQRGDAQALRTRAARIVPQWADAEDPLFPHVLARYAFALVENNLASQAEEAARQALAANAQVPCAYVAVAQALHVQGRFDEGVAWLRQHQDAWADERNVFAPHLWWHLALFRLEAMDLAGTQRLIDGHLGERASFALAARRIDATSLLWRLHLLGVDMRDRFAALVTAWPGAQDDAGRHALADLHRVLARLGAGDVAGAEHWIAACARRVLAAEDARRDNHRVAREVGLPLMRGMAALARGEAAAAVALLQPARAQAHRLGGTQVQRDLVDQSLLCAALHAGDHALGRALLNERLMARPSTPLTRHWADQLGDPEEARA